MSPQEAFAMLFENQKKLAAEMEAQKARYVELVQANNAIVMALTKLRQETVEAFKQVAGARLADPVEVRKEREVQIFNGPDADAVFETGEADE